MFTVQLTVSVKRQDDVVQLAFDLCFDDEEILSILLPQWEQDEKVISYEIRSGVGEWRPWDIDANFDSTTHKKWEYSGKGSV
jgi:hypothetical protein